MKIFNDREYVMPKQTKMSNVAYEQLNQDADRILHLIKFKWII